RPPRAHAGPSVEEPDGPFLAPSEVSVKDLPDLYQRCADKADARPSSPGTGITTTSPDPRTVKQWAVPVKSSRLPSLVGDDCEVPVARATVTSQSSPTGWADGRGAG